MKKGDKSSEKSADEFSDQSLVVEKGKKMGTLIFDDDISMQYVLHSVVDDNKFQNPLTLLL